MRNAIRLYSGLILASFVLTHLLNHSLGLISLEAMDRGRMILNAPWNNIVGGPLLLAAFFVHILNALYAIYRRTSLRMSNWEATQLSMGLAIPILLGPHLAGTFVGQFLAGHNPTYAWVVSYYWVLSPVEGGMQAAGLLAAWIHGSVGIHYWLRTKPGYKRYAPALLALSVGIAVSALSGFIAAGIGAQRIAEADPDFVQKAFDAMGLAGGNEDLVNTMVRSSIWTAIAVLAVPFILRSVRAGMNRVRNGPSLALPDGRKLSIQKGATVLETLRAAGIPHASVCGGRGRCTTCRVRVLKGGDALADPDGIEARALARIDAPPELRLACQIRPSADIAVIPLLPPRADADLAMAARLRGWAGRAPRKLPPFTSLIPSTVRMMSPRPSNLTPLLLDSWSPSSFPMSSQTKCMSLQGGRWLLGKRAWASMINSAVQTGALLVSMVASRLRVAHDSNWNG